MPVYLLNQAVAEHRAFALALTLDGAIVDLTLGGTTLTGENIRLAATADDINGTGALVTEKLLGVIWRGGEHLYIIYIIF